jgi:hypothetical protein
LYWIAAPLLLLCALALPWHLIGWVPHVGSFTMEMLSFTGRVAVAYLLFIAAWTFLASLTGANKHA